MKFFFSLLLAVSSGPMLLAQSGGQSSGGSVNPPAAPSIPSPPAIVPARPASGIQTSPLQSSPLQTSPITAPPPVEPDFGAPLDVGEGTGEPAGASRPVQPGTEGIEPGRSQPAPGASPQTTPRGLEPVDPSLPPLDQSLPPPVRGTIAPAAGEDISTQPGSEDRDPLEPLGTPGSGEGGFNPQLQQRLDQHRNDAFADRFRSLASAGTMQMAFPEENAMVTIVSQEGRLVLRGRVSNEEQRQNIERTIRQLSNPGFIDNQIEVFVGGGGQAGEP